MNQQDEKKFPPRLAIHGYSAYEDKSFLCNGLEVKEKGDYISMDEHNYLLNAAMDGYPALAEACKNTHDAEMQKVREKVNKLRAEAGRLKTPQTAAWKEAIVNSISIELDEILELTKGGET